MILQCEYCGQRGELGSVVEFRQTARGDEAVACIDTKACDERDNERAAKLEREARAEEERA